jgi:hypothetical protein
MELKAKRKIYLSLTYALTSMVLGSILIYPLVSHDAGTNLTSDSTKLDNTFSLPSLPNSNIQCKKITISTSGPVESGSFDNPIPSCPQGYVPIGIYNGNLTYHQGQTGNQWVIDTSGWLPVSIYYYDPLYYNKGTGALNQIQIQCGQRIIQFTSGPCP